MDTTLGISTQDKIAVAIDILTSISKDEIEQLCYLALKKFVLDMENDLRAERLKRRKDAWMEGWKESFMKGFMEGFMLGIRKSQLVAAIELIKMNLSVEQIQQATGLTPSEIEELKK